MNPGALLYLAVRSLGARKLSVFLTMLSVALSVALLLGVEKTRVAARTGFESTISGTDLVVGARSSPINLLLYSVFRLGDPLQNVSWKTYQQIDAHPDVAWTVPLSLGDSHRGYRVLGTTDAYLRRYRYGTDTPLRLADGGWFEDAEEVVLGATVAKSLGYAVGTDITLSHGIVSAGFADHDRHPLSVSGILAPTGTPVDRTVHVSLLAIEAIHAPPGTPHDGLVPQSVTATLVGMKSRPLVLRLQRQINTYRDEPLTAVIPGVALSQLWEVVGVAEAALRAVTGFVVLTGLLGLMASLLAGLTARRREMAVLRAIGLGPRAVFALLATEAVVIALAGAILGAAVVHAGLATAAPLLTTRFGFVLTNTGPGAFDLLVLSGVVLAALAAGCVPASKAYRDSLASGLSVGV